MKNKTEVLKPQIEEAELITNEIQIHIDKVNTFPQIIDKIKANEIELAQLIEEGKDLMINGVDDIEGAKKVDEHRLKEYRLRLATEKLYETPVNAAHKLHKYFVGQKEKTVSGSKADEKKKKEQYKDWEQLVRDRAIELEENNKKKFEERVKAVQDTGAKLEGLDFVIANNEKGISISLEGLKEITDDYFNNELLPKFQEIQEELEQIKLEEEELRLKKEKEDNTIIEERRNQINPYLDYIDFTDLELLEATTLDIETSIEIAKNKIKERESELEAARKEKAQRDKERKELVDQKKAQDEQQKIIDAQALKVKNESEKLERERKAKDRKELALKRAKEAEGKRIKDLADLKIKEAEALKANKERQERLKGDKGIFLDQINDFRRGLFLPEVAICLDNKEVIELYQNILEDLEVLIESYKQKIENL